MREPAGIEADQFERPVHQALDFGFFRPCLPGTEGHVVENGFLEQLGFRELEDQPHLLTQLSQVGLRGVYVPSLDPNRARIRFQQAVHVLNHRGLTGTVRSGQRDALPGVNLRGHIA